MSFKFSSSTFLKTEILTQHSCLPHRWIHYIEKHLRGFSWFHHLVDPCSSQVVGPTLHSLISGFVWARSLCIHGIKPCGCIQLHPGSEIQILFTQDITEAYILNFLEFLSQILVNQKIPFSLYKELENLPLKGWWNWYYFLDV